MSLALFVAQLQIRNHFQTHALTHLATRVQDSKLIIYSTEPEGEAYRAVLTPFSSSEYLLSIANHRGNWQPTPYIGPLPEIMAVLTGKLAFVLARWP